MPFLPCSYLAPGHVRALASCGHMQPPCLRSLYAHAITPSALLVPNAPDAGWPAVTNGAPCHVAWRLHAYLLLLPPVRCPHPSPPTRSPQHASPSSSPGAPRTRTIWSTSQTRKSAANACNDAVTHVFAVTPSFQTEMGMGWGRALPRAAAAAVGPPNYPTVAPLTTVTTDRRSTS